MHVHMYACMSVCNNVQKTQVNIMPDPGGRQLQRPDVCMEKAMAFRMHGIPTKGTKDDMPKASGACGVRIRCMGRACGVAVLVGVHMSCRLTCGLILQCSPERHPTLRAGVSPVSGAGCNQSIDRRFGWFLFL